MTLRLTRTVPLELALLLAAPLWCAAQAPAFFLPSVSGSPGQEIALPVQFHTGGTQVCAVSADASFDAAKLAFVSAEAGPAGTSASKNLVSQALGSGAVRLALIGMNSVPISDGVAFTLRLRIQPAASGTTAIGFHGGAATCAGQDLPPFSAAASLSIQGGPSEDGSSPTKGDEKSDTAGKGQTGSSESKSANSTASASSASTTETSAEAPPAATEEKEEASAEGEPSKPLSAKVVLTNRKGPSPLKVSLRAQVEGGKKPYEYAWEFGEEAEAGKRVREVHTYAKPGTYKPSLTVKDAAGESVAVKCDEVTVQDPPVPELAQAVLVPGEESWSLELAGKKFQKGATATVNGKEYATEFADAQRLVVKGLADPKGAEVKVSLANPYGKPCAPVKAATKAATPQAPGA